jgi:glycosyltransferase involved in cell wall biosynthesis
MTTPLVSVLLPVFNCEQFLAVAVRSILSQSFSNLELLLLDDGSTDRSRKIADKIAGTDDRVRVFSWTNRGIARSLNSGLDLARGSLIARMDADDIALPQRLERQVAFLEAHPEIIAVGTHALLVDPDGDPICPWFVRLENHEEIDRRLLSGDGGGAIVHPTVMIRREHLNAVGGYHSNYELAEDLDLFLRLAERGRLANIPEVLLQYRQHLGSIGVTRRKQQRASARRALEDAWKRRALPGSPPPDPSCETADPKKYLLTWTWLALMAGNIATARKFAMRTVRASPMSIDTWRAVACVIRGH